MFSVHRSSGKGCIMLTLIKSVIDYIKWGPKREFSVWKEIVFDPEESRIFYGHQFVVNNFAFSLLDPLPLLHEKRKLYRVVKVTLGELGQTRGLVNNDRMLACARYHGLLPCPPQLAIAIGNALVSEVPTDRLFLAMVPIPFNTFDIESNYLYGLHFHEQRGKTCLMTTPDKGPTASLFKDTERLFVLPN
jgi:hypothetical protein